MTTNDQTCQPTAEVDRGGHPGFSELQRPCKRPRQLSRALRSRDAHVAVKYSQEGSSPNPDAGDKKFNSRPVAPIILRNEPFGDYAEGLFHCEDASYRSTSVFKWHCTMVELTRRSDGTPLFAWRKVVQIPSPVLTVADRSFEA